jgi:4-hydroxybutyrate CoA-transferase
MIVYSSAEEAICQIPQTAERLFVQGAAATPTHLLEALIASASRFTDLEIIHLHVEGSSAHGNVEYAKHLKVANLFVGSGMRPHMAQPNVDYIPIFLSEIPNLFRSGRRKPDVAFVQVSPPDIHGYCSLGTSVDVALAAIETADFVIAQINNRMPRTHGDGIVHVSHIDCAVEHSAQLPQHPASTPGDLEKAIGVNVAELIEDGSTLQMGIGKIPDAVLASLTGHKHLGVHTEMMSDGILPLIECGAIDNNRKVVRPGKTTTGFLVGTQKLYDYVDDNPAVTVLDIAYINNPHRISRNPKVCAINSAVEVDITGQVCADSIGSKIISGVGDFIRGASLSEGGKPIIALPSRTNSGRPRIVETLQTGAGVVTTRAHVHYVVTEYGTVDLYGKGLDERRKLLASIAHPEDREALLRG